ncbi:hypothetical protein RCL1_001216 [Eukaryota sp. TZLM3-RCL]
MLILHNAVVVTHGSSNQIIENGAVAIDGSRIVAVGSSQEVLAKYSNAEKIIDLQGKMIHPGLICAHTHFYGVFSRGMGLKDEAPTTFGEILERLWWKLDKALDHESTKLSAEICIVEAIRCGLTTVFDHHASPSAIDGSLDVIADVCKQAGLRSCLCYEISNRNGDDEALAGLNENVRFIEKVSKLSRDEQEMIAGMIGLHAQFTVSDEILDKVSTAMKQLNKGAHIHVAEGVEDLAETNPVERLHKHGLTSNKSIFAHCVHVSEQDMDVLASTGTVVSHQPESNMNNAVGVANIPKMLEKNINVVLGTDGVHNDMISALKATYFVHKLAQKDPRVMGPHPAQILFQHNAKLATETFGVKVGSIEEGAVADLIILDYYNPTRINPGNFPWHVVFGMGTQQINSTMCNGKFLMFNHEILTMNEMDIKQRSRDECPKVWDRV